MKNGQNAPRRRKPASPRPRAAPKARQPERAPAESQPNLPNAHDASASRPQPSGLSPDVIWPETDPAAVVEMLRRWEQEDDDPDQPDTWEMLQRANPRKFPGLSPDVIWPDTDVNAAREMLRQWDEEDKGEEPDETGEFLRALDEHRLSYRKFRP
jgi:hypothetical protein